MIKLDYVGAANGLLYGQDHEPLTAKQGVLVQYWCEKENLNLITAVYYATDLKIKLGDVPDVKKAPEVPDDIAAAASEAQETADLAAMQAEAEKEKAPAEAEASDSSEKTAKRKKR